MDVAVWQRYRILLDRLRLRASYWQIPRGVRTLRQISFLGNALVVLANEDLGRRLAITGIFEPEETRYLSEALSATDTCLDVGANIGYYTVLASALASEGHVHAFEPIPLAGAILRLNVVLNARANVTVNEFALADERSRREFVIASDSAYSGFKATGRRPTDRSLQIDTRTIDDYVEERQIARVDFVKIDVEGAEGLVLRGARALLSGRRGPRLLLVELFDQNHAVFGDSIVSIVSLLGRHGYSPHVAEDGSLRAFRACDHNVRSNVFFLK